MSTPLNIHLSTDEVTGNLQIDFDPREDHHIPVDVAEWPDLRAELRERVREQLENEDGWKAHLHSNRRGERLDVRAGCARVDGEGTIHSIDMWRTDPDDVDW